MASFYRKHLNDPDVRRAHLLSDIEAEEVSLVDKGSNPHAKVALFKRDSGAEEPKKKKGAKMSKLETVCKSAIASRADVVEAVQKKARKIAFRENISLEKAEAKVWGLPGVYEAYESAKKESESSVYKRMASASLAQHKEMKITPAEAELNKRARKLMKSNPGMTYAKACSLSLMDDPSLYSQYQSQLAQGTTQAWDADAGVFKSDQTMPGADDSQCECGADLDGDENFCPNCGADLDGNAEQKRSGKGKTPRKDDPGSQMKGRGTRPAA